MVVMLENEDLEEIFINDKLDLRVSEKCFLVISIRGTLTKQDQRPGLIHRSWEHAIFFVEQRQVQL
jgi:hypothetical protein